MKRNTYLILTVAATGVALVCFLPLRAQTSADVNAAAQKINQQSQRLLDEQAERSKRTEALSQKRWELVRFALRKREFKLMRHFAFTRIESVNADFATSEKAIVQCRPAFESGVRVIMTLEREGTNGWRFERWFVTEKNRKPAPRPVLPGIPTGKTNAVRSIRPANERSGVDAGLASLFPFWRPWPGATHREC